MALKTWVAGDEIKATDLNASFATKVANTGDETIAGVKTFSSAPKSSVAATADTELVRYGEAVLDTGNQTIAGIKTFSSIPVLPAADPTTDNQATRRSFVVARGSEPLVAGDTLVASSDTIISHQTGTWTKKKEIKIGERGGIFRIKFAIRVNWPGGDTCYGRIYKNGSPFGTERSHTGDGDYETFSEDLVFATWDLVQAYVKVTGGDPQVNLKEFRIYRNQWDYVVNL